MHGHWLGKVLGGGRGGSSGGSGGGSGVFVINYDGVTADKTADEIHAAAMAGSPMFVHDTEEWGYGPAFPVIGYDYNMNSETGNFSADITVCAGRGSAEVRKYEATADGFHMVY